MSVWCSVLKGILIAEVVIFVCIMTIGPVGMIRLKQRQAILNVLENKTIILMNEIAQLEQDLIAWNNDPFYKEKIAREKLQLARPNDEIYFVS